LDDGKLSWDLLGQELAIAYVKAFVVTNIQSEIGFNEIPLVYFKL